jgi:protein-tyrosine phosphatase
MSRPFRYEARNLRDIGGFRTPRGWIRTGQLYRSAHLDSLNATEIAMLRRLNVGVAVDLRQEIEKAQPEERAAAVVPGLQVFDVGVNDAIDPEALAAIVAVLAQMKTAAEARAWMCEQYAAVVVRHRSDMLAALQLLMASPQPAVFFCVAGKDRTGIVAAFLLLILGVLRKDLLRDYMRTNKYLWGLLRKRDRSARAQYGLNNVKMAVIDALSEAHPAYLDAALVAVQKNGGPEGYFSGIDSAMMNDFRRRLMA